MLVYIFEGIATSSKSTVINALANRLPGHYKVRVYSEQFTHIPIIKKLNEPCNDFFTHLISEAFAGGYDVLLFDRLYLTQALRAKKHLDDYLDVEMLLFTQDAKTIFLYVKPEQIVVRIAHAMTHRDPEWEEYVATKGEGIQEQAQYYIDQQKKLRELLGQSRLDQEAYDVTDGDYERVIKSLRDEIIRTVV
jgi:thymidylate kinase